MMDLLRQQRLPSWQPLLTPRAAALCLTIVAVLFLPIGVALTLVNNSAFDLEVRYDNINHCTMRHNQGLEHYSGTNGETLRAGCLTTVDFELTAPLKAPVYLYYGLSKFYQSHRRFANSKSDAQVRGDVSGRGLGDCAPLASPPQLRPSLHGASIELSGPSNAGVNSGTKRVLSYDDMFYAPAGLIPWTMFNDSFRLYRRGVISTARGGVGQLVCDGAAFSRATNLPLVTSDRRQSPNGCHKKGIAWDVDTRVRYRPLDFFNNAGASEREEGNPRVWSAPRAEYDAAAPVFQSNDTYYNNGWYAGELGHAIPVTTDEDLMVWARVASLPRFRKLYRVIDVDLEPGAYTMEIREFYDVSSFGGEKFFALAKPSWLGGQNFALSNIYLAVGILAAVSAVGFARLQSMYVTRSVKALGELAVS